MVEASSAKFSLALQKSLSGKLPGPIKKLPALAAISKQETRTGYDEILWEIYELRKRLGWPYKGIELGNDPVDMKTVDTTVKVYPDDGQFRYCIERGESDPRSRYNPYDLIVTTEDIIKSYSKYYTVTATYVTMVCTLIHLFIH